MHTCFDERDSYPARLHTDSERDGAQRLRELLEKLDSAILNASATDPERTYCLGLTQARNAVASIAENRR